MTNKIINSYKTIQVFKDAVARLLTMVSVAQPQADKKLHIDFNLNVFSINLIEPVLAFLQWHQECEGISPTTPPWMEEIRPDFLTCHLQAEPVFSL